MVAALARASAGGVALIEPKSMQEATQETKPVVLVDDTQLDDPGLKVTPKSSCRHCHGRGYVGTNVHTRKKIICRCVKKAFDRANRQRMAENARLKAASVTASKGWDDPKAPVGNPEAVPA